MTNVEIVKAAINALNKNKNTNINYDTPKDDGEGGVEVNVKYPQDDWHLYGFDSPWFTASPIYYEECTWMEGFKVSDELRKTNPEAVMILRIAWYFYKTGRDNELF